MHLDHFRPWSPDDPFLYDVYVQTEDDTIKSYFGMRKFAAARDANTAAAISMRDSVSRSGRRARPPHQRRRAPLAPVRSSSGSASVSEAKLRDAEAHDRRTPGRP